jgi:ankyrin repeat protein
LSDDTEFVKFILSLGAEPNAMLDPRNEFGGNNGDNDGDNDDDDGYKDATKDFDFAEEMEEPDSCNKNKFLSPLFAAINLGNLPIVELLLDSGADHNCPWIKHDKAPVRTGISRSDTYSPLAAAVQNGNTQILHRLLRAGASVNSPSSTPTVLQAAVNSGDINLVQLLISMGAKVNAIAAEGVIEHRTALQIAVSNGNISLVKLLLDAGANANDHQHGIMSHDASGKYWK